MPLVRQLIAVCAALLVPSAAQAEARDWSGAYAGLQLSGVSGQYISVNSGVQARAIDFDGQLAGIALGYNLQHGALVYGGELAYSPNKMRYPRFDTRNYLDGLLDVKARLGFASGKVLVYGTVGWASTGRYFANASVTNEPIVGTGLSFGIGADVMVSDRVYFGLEWQEREVSTGENVIAGAPELSIDHNIRTMSLRLGIRF